MNEADAAELKRLDLVDIHIYGHLFADPDANPRAAENVQGTSIWRLDRSERERKFYARNATGAILA